MGFSLICFSEPSKNSKIVRTVSYDQCIGYGVLPFYQPARHLNTIIHFLVPMFLRFSILLSPLNQEKGLWCKGVLSILPQPCIFPLMKQYLIFPHELAPTVLTCHYGDTWLMLNNLSFSGLAEFSGSKFSIEISCQFSTSLQSAKYCTLLHTCTEYQVHWPVCCAHKWHSH